MAWSTDLDSAAAELGCSGPFVARTVVENGLAFTADSNLALDNIAQIIRAGWSQSWESFLP